jgi:hypothetical protein
MFSRTGFLLSRAGSFGLELEDLLGYNRRKGKRNCIMFQSYICFISGQKPGT